MGFACQPYSGAGNGKGFADHRADMLVFGTRFIAAIMLRVVALENVIGFTKGHRGKWVAKVRQLLAAAGYKVSVEEVDAIDTPPQHRKRVLLVGL
eukprot:11871675-Alexandrium_andersonii.AAC.1